VRPLRSISSNIFNSYFVKDCFFPSNMIGTLWCCTPTVSSESRVEVEYSGDVDSEITIISNQRCRSHHQAHQRRRNGIIRWCSYGVAGCQPCQAYDSIWRRERGILSRFQDGDQSTVFPCWFDLLHVEDGVNTLVTDIYISLEKMFQNHVWCKVTCVLKPLVV
jgi:hypothetical protein